MRMFIPGIISDMFISDMFIPAILSMEKPLVDCEFSFPLLAFKYFLNLVY
ncbi:hypothetical protein [Methanosphaera sp.]